MQIQLNTDNNIRGDESLVQQVETLVKDILDRFSDQITRVEVHLNDVNSHKSGQDDIRCVMEARVGGREPIAVSDQAATITQALHGAIEKLERHLESNFGRLRDRN